MNVSQAQVNRIKNRETFSATAYRDGSTNGVPNYSIGYGHQIRPNEQSLRTGKISLDTAEALLRSDIAPLEKVMTSLRILPTQNQYDALIDFGFNCGSGALSKVITTWNTTKDTAKVTAEIAAYNKTHDNNTDKLVVSSELVSRRNAEIALFNSKITPTIKTTALLAIIGTGLALIAFS